MTSNQELINAVKNGNIVVVERLLQDKRVDPSGGNNWAIQRASCLGHLEIVNLLLQDERVDPSDNQNWAIQYASHNGYPAVVERLLQDKRVDPSTHNNLAIKFAYQQSKLAIFERLLQDERVDPNIIQTKNTRLKIEEFSEKSVSILAAKLVFIGGKFQPIIHWKPRIDKYREELFAIAGDLTVVLDETLDNSGLQRYVWEMVYKYLGHKLPYR
jgi:hypothetical protein